MKKFLLLMVALVFVQACSSGGGSSSSKGGGTGALVADATGFAPRSDKTFQQLKNSRRL